MSAAELYNHLYPAADPTIHQDRLFQVYFQIFSTVCLKLAATNSSDQRLRLFLNLDLKQFYSLRLSLNTDLTCRQRLSSYDRIIIIIIISYKVDSKQTCRTQLVMRDKYTLMNDVRIIIIEFL